MHNTGAEMKKLLALGDSYTIGEAVPAEGSFPYQLTTMLNAAGLYFDVPDIVAKTGWTTDELLAAIEKRALTEQYDFVTLLIGVNNQYRAGDIDTYEKEFRELLLIAMKRTLRSGLVYVLSIPDWGVTPFAEGRDRNRISQEINAFNTINRRISAENKVYYIEITEGTREASFDKDLIAKDGLHPSEKEYARWAQKIAAHYTTT